jgi:hypothetical protein
MALDKVERGRAAEALLENPLLREVLNALGAYYTAAWRSAATPEAREDCHRYVRLTEKLIGDIASIANTGMLERARIKELERGKKGLLWPTI